MAELNAAQKRLLENATLFSAIRLIMKSLRENFECPLLAEVINIHNGQGLKVREREQSGRYSVYASGGLVGNHSEKLTEESFVVIGRKGSAGKITFAPYGGWVIDTAYYAQPKQKEVLKHKFLFYALSSIDFTGNIISTAIPGINRTSIYKYSIPLPPISTQKACIEFFEAVERRQQGDKSINLPELPSPIAEQRRIVARIEELAAKIEEARGLREGAIAHLEALYAATSSNIFGETLVDGRLADVLLDKPRNGWSARCDNMPHGIPVLSLGAVTGFNYRAQEFKRTSEPVSENAHYWLKIGDLLITRSNTPELVGHAAIYDGSPTPCIYPDLMMRLDIDEEKARKKFVHHWLASRTVRDFIRLNAKGTSPTMKKIAQGIVMNIPFPSSLSLKAQADLVAYLDDLKARINQTRVLREDALKESDALLPAILDKAFKGEL